MDQPPLGRPGRYGETLTEREKIRYGRHLSLAEVGEAGQERLKNTSVLVIGLGGLGSPLSLYLTAAGIGRLTIVDFDQVSESNLQRQILFSTPDVGTPKVDVAFRRLLELNPDIRIESVHKRFGLENAAGLVADHDIVADGADNFATRFLVNDACVLGRRPLVSSSLLAFEGQLSVFNYDGGPCYRCLYPEPPPPGLIPSCAEGGVLGALCGVMGSLQAVEVIKVALGQASLSGQLLHVDAWTMQIQKFRLRKSQDCPVCGAHPAIRTLQETVAQCGLPAAEIPEITARELAQAPAGRFFFLDVREADEVAKGQIKGAHWIPLGELRDRLAEIPRAQEILVYCKTGVRSRRAAETLLQDGREVLSLTGGVGAWARDIDPSFAVG